MHYSITISLHPRQWSHRWIVAIVGCAALTMLDRHQSPALAQAVSAADFAAPTLTAPDSKVPIAPAAAPTLSATQAVLLVNPTVEKDAVADGSDRAPFKTITQALQVAPAGTTILLSPGIYSQETGETFPLRLKPDVIVQGNTETRGQGIVIQGSGFFLSPTFARQNVAIVGADRAILAGVTIKNPDPQGYGVWIESTSPAILDSTFTESGHDGISVTGNGSPLIRNNYFYQNGANGITIYGTSRAEVRENIFEQTGFAININQKAAPLLVGNRITQNKDGIVVQASSQPVLRNNSVDSNTRDGLVAIGQSRPNLGTAASPGGNSFRGNGQFDVNAKGLRQPIPAFGNDLSKTIGTLDLAGTSVEGPAPSGLPMPWSSSAALRSTVSAQGLTVANDKSAARSVPKQTAGTPSLAATHQATVSTISFGQRLVSDHSTGKTAQTMIPQALQRPPVAASGEPTESDISAASFPVPAAQSTPVPSRAIVPLVAVTPPASVASEPAFPVPTALSGGIIQSPPLRPVQVVRLTTMPSTPVPKAVKEPPVFSARLPSAVPIQRPVTQQNSVPIAIIAPPRAIASPSRSPLPTSPLPRLKPAFSAQTGSIAIPVPAPEQRSIPSSIPVRSFVATPSIAKAQSRTLASAELLPVPDPNAPIGRVGSIPNVYHGQQNASSSLFASNRAALGLRYRVVIEADDSQQAQLRATFPNAFRTSIKGRSLMQVGAFGDRTKADQLRQTLSSQGVQAMVETLE